MNMLRSKPGLLFLFLVLHLANCCNGNSYVPLPRELVESQLESWVVERRSSQHMHMATDWFTLNMKPTFQCLHEWCQYRFNARYHSGGVNDSHCTCYCNKRGGFSSFLPSVRKCINASMAASFAGCQKYFNRNTLLNTPVDLTRQRRNNDLTFEFQNNNICNLNASYFHDYEGFQSNWRYVTDGFFVLKKTGIKFSVQWQPDTHRMLSGRIIRLNITCGASTTCFLFKAKGSVIYKNVSSPWSSSSTTSPLPPISSSLSSSSTPSLSTSSLASDLSPVSSSLQLPLSSVPWQPSSSSLLQLTKSSVTSISSLKLSQSPTSVKTSSSEMLLLKPTSSYSTSDTLTMPSMEPSWVTPTSTAAFIEPGSKERQIEEKGSGVLIGAAVGSTLLAGAVFLILLICWRKRRAGESKRKEKKHVEVGNPVYGISNDEFQMEKAKGSAQDGQPRYQYPSNTGQNVGETVYSNPDSNYDNYCTVYQSLEKPTPGSTVYQSLEEQIPVSSVYQNLNSDQEKPSDRIKQKHGTIARVSHS
ncbi:uncharacterized protein LOC122963539 isoform X2 [Acropora millepora]|uniref:uncharacterized protein LOC122963539 isoform X2 n=1 Tax=Acropora millepora TaxID=45264 RepID=UPI001CF3C4EF|nr:uncharacterized protein LOC122963539 isoform X2 [Acropora millepora]